MFYECGNAACGAGYAVFLYGGCPRCGSHLFEKEGAVPKATLGGVSNADAAPGEVGYIPPESADAHASDDAAATAEAVADESTPAHADDDADAADAVPARPASAAPKADWVAWAIGCGLSEADAEGMTKAALMAWDPYPAPGDTEPDEGSEPDVAAELTITAEAEVTHAEEPGE